jgi:predicted nucleic acid-binding protein
VSAVQFLIDTSALVRILRDPEVRSAWRQEITAGRVATCPIVELELLYSARSAAGRAELSGDLRQAFSRVVMPDRGFARAVEVQDALTDRGTHRSAGVVDLLVAATGEAHGLTVLHYDADFLHVAEVTGQSVRWVAEPGSVS